MFSFPEIAFFRDEQMQDALIDVLFSYCREHDIISYKQVSGFIVRILSPVSLFLLAFGVFICLVYCHSAPIANKRSLATER